MNLPVLTHSAMAAARACMRLYRNRYVLRLRPIRDDRENAELGDLVHVGLEAWWMAHGLQRILAAVRAMKRRAAEKKVDPFQVAKAEALLIGYHARWIEDADRYETVGAEVEFRAPLTNPDSGAHSKTFRIGGKIDVIARDLVDARVLTVEHKTSSEDIGAGSFYWLRLHMDSQVSVYFDGARALDVEPDGCLYDVIGKPDLRPSQVPVLDEAGEKIVVDSAGQRVRTKDGKKWRQTGDTAAGYVVQTRIETPAEFRDRILAKIEEDPEKYFERGEVARDSSDLEEAARDRWQLATLLRDSMRTGVWPRNPDACMRYGRSCEFVEACAGRADLNDPFLFRRVENVHPELSPDADPELAGPASIPSREETAA